MSLLKLPAGSSRDTLDVMTGESCNSRTRNLSQKMHLKRDQCRSMQFLASQKFAANHLPSKDNASAESLNICVLKL